MKPSILHLYPFLRIFLPFAIGIICGNTLFFKQKNIPMISYEVILIIFLILLMGNYFFRKYAIRWLFGFFLTLDLLLLGTILIYTHLQKTNVTFPSTQRIYQVIVDYPPISKKNNVQIKVNIIGILNKTDIRPFKAKALLYFPKTSTIMKLKRGDILLVYSYITCPYNYKNPDSFNYSHYLLHKGISGTGMVQQNKWKYIRHIRKESLYTKALQYRQSILKLYRSFNWDNETFSIISALTVGYQDEISNNIRETYSKTGTSHILAISGLHIGFFYALLLFLFQPIKRFRHTNAIRYLIIIITLWLFAFLTGLSTSVTRAATMFSFFAVAKILRRSNLSLNTLLGTAFFMLLSIPEWLFDIGFQLSFCAVASILLFKPFMNSLIRSKTKFNKQIWELIIISIVAQIGTMPLIIYYFSYFPIYSILSGLVAIPLTSLIMYISIFLLICTPLPTLQLIAAALLQKLILILNSTLRLIEHLPYASIKGIWIYSTEIFLFYFILLSLRSFFSFRKVKYVYLSLTGILTLGVAHIFFLKQDLPQNSIEFYNIRSCPTIHCIASNKQSWLICTNNRFDTLDLRKKMSPHWNRLHLHNPQIITNQHKDQKLFIINNILSYGKIRIAIINDDRWRYRKTCHPLSINYLYICNGYRGKLEELLTIFNTDKIVIDNSLSNWRQQYYAQACLKNHIPFIFLRNGSYKIEI